MYRCAARPCVKRTTTTISSFKPYHLSILPTYSTSTRSLQPVLHSSTLIMPKRKSATVVEAHSTEPIMLVSSEMPPPKRRASGRHSSKPQSKALSTNPEENANVLDAPGPLRASPDAEEEDERMDLEGAGMDVEKQVKDERDDEPFLTNGYESDSPLSEISEVESPVKSKTQAELPKGKAPTGGKASEESQNPASAADRTKAKKEPRKESQFLDPEADDLDEADEEEIQAALSRPPPVNSDYLPLPWKGRIGYVILQSPKPMRLYSLCIGMPLYLSPLLQSSCLHLPHLPHRLHPRKSPPTQGPQGTAPRHKEPPRPRAARKHRTWPRIRRKPGPSQRTRHYQNAPLERPLRHQIHAP